MSRHGRRGWLAYSVRQRSAGLHAREELGEKVGRDLAAVARGGTDVVDWCELLLEDRDGAIPGRGLEGGAAQDRLGLHRAQRRWRHAREREADVGDPVI